MPEISVADLNNYILQKQNSYMLSFMRTKLGLYSLSGSDTTKWINRTLRRLGEDPVIFDEGTAESTKEVLNQVVKNKGFLNSDVKINISTKKKKTNVTYIISGGEPYKIGNFEINIPHDSIRQILQRSYSREPLRGELFDVDLLNEERSRAAQNLRRMGYYTIQKEMFAYAADTAASKNTVDLTMVLQPQYAADSVVGKLFRKKTIDKVTIYCFTNSTIQDEDFLTYLDTVFYKDYRIIYNHKKHIFTPKILVTKTVLASGQIYNERLVDRTNANLASLSAVKYVNVSFAEKYDDLLDCSIYVSPSDRFGYSVELEGTTTMPSDFGVGVKVSYFDKNVFHGAETFKLGANVAYEALGIAERNSAGEIIHRRFENAFSVGGDASLSVPQILIPFLKQEARKRYGGTTAFSLNYNYQHRPQRFDRHIANATMRYTWQRRNTRFTFNLIDWSYTFLPNKDTTYFKNVIDQPGSFIKFSFEDHLTTEIGFAISTTNQRADSRHQSFYTLRANISAAGNILWALRNITKQKLDTVNNNNRYTIFGTPYAQFIKGEMDFSYNQFISERLRFVFHTSLGIGLPYGNSKILPFEERFITNLRGWDPRSLGPGTYQNPDSIIRYMEQSGDIKFEINAELRFKLFWLLEGAFFVDAGNVWTIKNYPEQTGGVFSFKKGKFFEQLGCNYGFGIRADFSFFILRLDLGLKLYDPRLPAGDRWRLGTYDEKYKDYYFSFGIGYPF
ncbi:MAG: BamA/TamA family outer membrane protein [Prevotellaceae bacterium]|nr:BamA/TamA family outer membrane protein [Prevotellaceae bacterium]